MASCMQYWERVLCYGYSITSEGVMTAPLVLSGSTFSE